MGMLGFYFLYFIMLEIIILISGIINLILGLVVLFGSEQKRGRVAFAFFSAMTFLWALCNFFLYSSDFPIFVRLAYSAGALVLTSIIFWVLIFTSRSKVKKYKSISVFAIGIIIAVLPLATDLVVNNRARFRPGYRRFIFCLCNFLSIFLFFRNLQARALSSTIFGTGKESNPSYPFRFFAICGLQYFIEFYIALI